MNTPTASEVLEEVASAIVMADAADANSYKALPDLLGKLKRAARREKNKNLEAAAVAGMSGLAATVGQPTERVAAALESLSKALQPFQEAEPPPPAPAGKTEETPRADASQDRVLVLPPWANKDLLGEFLTAQLSTLETLEVEILALEKGDKTMRASLMARLHTVKGESAALGLNDLEKVVHGTEDFLLGCTPTSETTDRLLKVRDWIAQALADYGDSQTPASPAADALALLTAPAAAVAPTPVVPASVGAAPEPAKVAVVADAVARDDETVSLLGEFFSESEDGLAQADSILMNAERDGVTKEAVHALFRVFHTMKGVAGFLEIKEVTTLAHTTETMLNLCREGTLELKGDVLDAVLDATDTVRRMLDEVKAAVKNGTRFVITTEHAPLLARLAAASNVTAPAPKPAAPPPPPAPAPVSAAPAAPVVTAPVVAAPVAAPVAPAPPPPPPMAAAAAPAAPAPVSAPVAVAAPAPAANGEAPHQVQLKETIKVDVERVDNLVETIGELVIVESMVVNSKEIASLGSLKVRTFLGQLAKVTRDLQDVGMRMRMVPVQGVFQKMERVLRDTARKAGKQVTLSISGQGAEMDRSMVEQIADPLVHMIRNSVDHGIESPEVRKQKGKPAEGKVRLAAFHEGGNIIVEVADDGKGLDKDAIRRKALAQGLIKESDNLSDADIHGLIFAPGFSTAAQVTEISGRGVGMDVVKRGIEAMRGRVIITSVPGEGTTFKIVLPLTLAIIDGMLVACGKERYIIPTLSIVESLRPDAGMLVSMAAQHEMINLRGEILPLLRLDRIFKLPDARQEPTEALVVVVEGFGSRLGLLVDDVLSQQQVVIKKLGEGLEDVRFVSGAAILADGHVGMILNVEEMTTLVRDRNVRRVKDDSPRASTTQPEATP